MTKGPLGIPRPLVRCELALMYSITGIPDREDQPRVFNELETRIRDDIPVRVKDVFIQTGQVRLKANTAKIAVVFDTFVDGLKTLQSVNQDDQLIRDEINRMDEIVRITNVQVVFGDPEQEVRE